MKLQLSKGFYLQFQLISRLMEQAKSLHAADRFSPDDVVEAMGFSKGKVESIASFGASMGVLKPRSYLPTALGELVLAQDTYFEDTGTLWLCHYNLATDSACVVWPRMVNRVLPQGGTVERAGARKYFADLVEKFSAESASRHLGKELQVFFNAYAEQHFNRLHYLVEEEDGKFRINQPVPVPDFVFAAAIVTFRNLGDPSATAVDIPALCDANNSVGRVFAMREAAVRDTLDRLHKRSILTIESRADLDQVRLPASITAVELMRLYYSERWQ